MKKIKIFFIFIFTIFLATVSFPQNPIQKKSQNSSMIYPNKTSSLNLKEVFMASPIIYCTLLIMSFVSFVILLFTIFTFKKKDIVSKKTKDDLKNYLEQESYEDALNYCKNIKNLLSTMISSGINARKHGAQHIINTIKSEGRRATASIWQRISILNDIAIIAPMLGLLGTVIGMFYSFYDINRSIDSLSALFDGLGIAVGTTVAGLTVSILATIFYAILKFRIVKTLNIVENEAVILGNLINTK